MGARSKSLLTNLGLSFQTTSPDASLYVQASHMFGTSTIKIPRKSSPSHSSSICAARHILTTQSYNHDFSKAEIAFIMAQKHLVQGNVIKEVLKCFKEAFPYHDWKSYVDELLAIEAAVEKHNRDPQYVFPRWFYSS